MSAVLIDGLILVIRVEIEPSAFYGVEVDALMCNDFILKFLQQYINKTNDIRCDYYGHFKENSAYYLLYELYDEALTKSQRYSYGRVLTLFDDIHYKKDESKSDLDAIGRSLLIQLDQSLDYKDINLYYLQAEWFCNWIDDNNICKMPLNILTVSYTAINYVDFKDFIANRYFYFHNPYEYIKHIFLPSLNTNKAHNIDIDMFEYHLNLLNDDDIDLISNTLMNIDY